MQTKGKSCYSPPAFISSIAVSPAVESIKLATALRSYLNKAAILAIKSQVHVDLQVHYTLFWLSRSACGAIKFTDHTELNNFTNSFTNCGS